MPLSLRDYNRLNADPKRSEAAKKAARTRKRNWARNRSEFRHLNGKHAGGCPEICPLKE